MTRTARHPLLVRLDAPERSRRCIELVWDLSSGAGRALAARCGLEERFAAVALRVVLAPARERAHVSLEAITARGRHTLRRERTLPARWSREGDLEHVDIEGVLRCTIRRQSARALYAHSPLLASLGIPPGAYSLGQAPPAD